MGAVTMEKSTSLDRLKALDKLSSLIVQLQEAQELCNHPSRAEMILRWLGNKLRSLDDARTDAGSWDVFSSCLRLLPTQKIASILGSGNLQEILTLTCAERGLSERTLQAMVATWDLLSQQSLTATGAAIKALLKVDGASAARVCGHWYQHVYAVLQMEDSASRIDTATSLLHLGLQLWDLRRRSPSDDGAFSDHCLLPACQLVVLLKRTRPVGAKRKRGAEARDSSCGILRALESVIVQHSILPARSVFTSTRQRQDGHKKRLTPNQTEQGVEKLLQPLKDPSICYEAAPALMDMALSAVSTPTPGLRSREAPWIETLFDALLDLLDGDSKEQKCTTIADMLRHIRLRKIPFSTQKLATLATSVLADASGHRDSGRTLIAEVVSFNAGVLTETSIARLLFDAVGGWQASCRTPDTKMIRERIIAPVIEAFAQKQQLSELLELWHQQLISIKNDQSARIWLAIVSDMSEALASTSAHDVATSALARYSGLLQQLADLQESLTGNGVADRLRSDLVLLRALLQGLRSNSHSASIQQALESTRKRLWSLGEINKGQVPASCVSEVWQLLALVLELWFPPYCAAQSDASAVKDTLENLVGNDLFEKAVNDCQSGSDSSLAAQVLVGIICTLARSYNTSNKCTTTVDRAIEALCKRPATLMSYPQLITGLSLEQIGIVLQAVLSAQDEDSQCLLSLLSYSLPHSEKFDTVLEEMPMHLLVAFSPSTLAPSRRTKMIRRLLDRAHANDAGLLPASRLAFIIDLLAYPVEALDVSKTASELCDYIRRAIVPAGHEDREVAASCEEYARALALVQPSVQAVLRKTSAKTGRDYQELSAGAVATIASLEQGQTKIDSISSPTLLAVCVLIATIEETAEVASAYAHRNKQFVNMLMDDLVTSLENAMPTLEHDPDPESFSAVAEGLVNLPESILALSGSKRKKFESRIVTSAEQVLQTELKSPHHVQVASFRLLCKYDPTSDATTRATSVLSRDLDARSSGAVYRTWEDYFDNKFGPEEISRIITSGPPQHYAMAQLHLYMVRKIRGQLFEATTDPSTIDLWHYLLRTLLKTQDLRIRGEALQNMAVLLKARGFVLNQYSLEQTLQSLHSLLTSSSHIEAFFPKVCKILNVLINQYRTKLQGRFHLVTMIFQALLSKLLEDASSASVRLRDYHARLVAKLLELFCKPIWVRSTATSLVDASREAQKYAGQFVQHILHHYCATVLSSTPTEEVRLAIRPGIFAVIEAMEAYDETSVRSLSAAMNGNERAILRMVVQDWRQFGKWEGS
ncbi:hypothetical protein CERZMDRAFT_95226 [Cercospora zeae-maydis SCOH1-5]|uniref:Nucleolar 27S pre-rRNA processing Urb2/Npa2 C-terminal domain-containing protein n=1 Tax=Cercospora zeae-maydis SCOH1-5 TaxID=717836 RepID=A0A6A6FN24_9PEZI|nr:hypothetical protein CERZMDRAFT_95226 [Cercospora zeae-maydis SCOH1-5]